MVTVHDHQILFFKSATEWETWLISNQDLYEGLWLKIAKKASGIQSVTYDEALKIALCYGWIDGQKKSFDEKFFIQKFTPRRLRSIWSKRNVGIVQRLIDEGKMRPGGLAEVQRAQADGRWQAAYDSQTHMTMPADFEKAVGQIPAAAVNFAKLNKAGRYSIAWRLETAVKPESRARRFAILLEKLERGEAI